MKSHTVIVCGSPLRPHPGPPEIRGLPDVVSTRIVDDWFMADSSDPGNPPPSVQLVLELNPGPVPIGHLHGSNVDTTFSGWMQFLAAIEEALAKSAGGAPASTVS
jgi:hypothetical protein